VEVHDRQTSYDYRLVNSYSPDATETAGRCITVHQGFQPRIGLAWTPGGLRGRTVLRTAWGVLNYLESTGTNRRLSMNPPYVYDFFLAYDSRTIGQKIYRWIPAFGPALAAEAALRAAASVSGPMFSSPAIIQQWNLTLEHQFANNLTFSAGYVGQDASHLVISDRFWSQPVLGDGATPAAAADLSCHAAGNRGCRDQSCWKAELSRSPGQCT
jgi:hypothetical protein